MRQLHDYLRKGSRHLIVSSLPGKVWAILEKAQLVEHLGRDNLLVFDELNPHQSIESALKRAKTLLDSTEREPPVEAPHIGLR